MAGDPSAALDQLRGDARSGVLASVCADLGITLLVAFGSATDPDWSAPPNDLDLAVVMTGDAGLLDVVNGLTSHLACDALDVMDLGRADTVARAEALRRGVLLHESAPGTFAEMQILAVVQHADTQWMRDLQLEALAR
ncbi:MAG: hypothetical protein S0880_14850 [Actinomycetota bacterium]|nr:hypothetical protein [Actinomycetota bacterium]